MPGTKIKLLFSLIAKVALALSVNPVSSVRNRGNLSDLELSFLGGSKNKFKKCSCASQYSCLKYLIIILLLVEELLIWV